jgi:hypothetical protein
VAQEAHDVLELVEQLGETFHGGLQRSAERRVLPEPFGPVASPSAAKAPRAFSAQVL